MALLSATNLQLSFSGHVVLDGATLAIREGEKVGIVGRNGCGKSSFLKMAAGVEQPDSGTLAFRNDMTMGYLPQDFELDESATVLENIRDGAKLVLDMIDRYENGSVSEHEMVRLQDGIEALHGWTLDTRIETIMKALGVPEGSRPVPGLSGGEKRRVALCRALVMSPDLLILDEPTNHLDTESIAWLESFLKNSSCACLFVTHDRYFLDRIATRIAELFGGVFYSHEGNYSSYLETKAERMASEENREAKRQKFLRSELEWVRAGVKARTTKSRSRLDSYYKVASMSGPEREVEVDLLIPPPPKLANVIVELESVSAAYGDDPALYHDLDLKFEAGTCTGVIGRNGIGKTTLLKTILGERVPETGEVTIGKRTVFNYVDQTRMTLDEEKSLIQEVGGNMEYLTFGEEKINVRSYLRRFLFSDDRINMKIANLSGGEKSRVLLAKILCRGGNFIILDEPTNDLDLSTLRVLEDAILGFSGCVLVVSHDRYFLDRVCDRMISFEGDGVVRINDGNYSYYMEKRAQWEASQKAGPRGKAKGGKSKSQGSDPKGRDREQTRPRKLSYKEERELESVEPEMAAIEVRIAAIEEKFASPDFYRDQADQVEQLNVELEALRRKLESRFARWEELELIKSQFEANT